MAYDPRTNRMRRQDAVGMDELVKEFIREMRLSAGLNKQRIEEAWNNVSGAGIYTLDVSYDKGVLYCTINSSMVRNQLYFQKDILVQTLNEELQKDELLTWDWSKGPCVKSLVLR
jgi:hypothetical protein